MGSCIHIAGMGSFTVTLSKICKKFVNSICGWRKLVQRSVMHVLPRVCMVTVSDVHAFRDLSQQQSFSQGYFSMFI